MENTEVLLPLCFFRPVQQFPQSGQQQNPSKEFLQQFCIQHGTNPGKYTCRNTSGYDCRKSSFPVQASLPPPEQTGNQRGGNKKQQIDPPGDRLRHSQYNGQPQNQKTASADADAGQKTKYCAENQNEWYGF